MEWLWMLTAIGLITIDFGNPAYQKFIIIIGGGILGWIAYSASYYRVHYSGLIRDLLIKTPRSKTNAQIEDTDKE